MTIPIDNLTMDELIAHRGMLATNADCGDAFPGSKAWVEANKWSKEWEAFDASHPEVLAEIRRRHTERLGKIDPWSI